MAEDEIDVIHAEARERATNDAQLEAARSLDDLPLMVLCLTRPTLYERRPLWGSGQGNHERINLAIKRKK